MTKSIDHLEKIYGKYGLNYLIRPHGNIFQPQTSTTQRNVHVKMCHLCILGTADPVDMPAEREEKLLPVDCPDFDGFIIRSCDKSLSIT